METAV